MVKIYIAASLECQERCKNLSRDIVFGALDHIDNEFEIVSTWTERSCQSEDLKEMRHGAILDFSETVGCDVLIHAFPEVRSTGGGADTELGLALAMGKRVIVYGDRTNVFHWLPKVVQVADFSSLIEELRK